MTTKRVRRVLGRHSIKYLKLSILFTEVSGLHDNSSNRDNRVKKQLIELISF